MVRNEVVQNTPSDSLILSRWLKIKNILGTRFAIEIVDFSDLVSYLGGKHLSGGNALIWGEIVFRVDLLRITRS